MTATAQTHAARRDQPLTMTHDTDRIEKKILLHAPRERVWRAISEPKQFGHWFGVKFDGTFAPGTRITGKITPTQVDPQVAKMQEPHSGTTFDFIVDRIEPLSLFSFRWHPYATDPAFDYSSEPMTLVVFELQDASEGTLLTITESGFDQLPPARRAEAFKANEGGWTHQTKLIEKYLDQTA